MITILFENPTGVDLPGTSSPAPGSSGTSSPVNLALGTKTGTTLPITNSNGTGVVLPAATATEAGLLTGAKSEKLDNLPTNFNESVDDRVAALLVGGSNITLTYDDPANTLTISTTGGGSSSGLKVITSIKDDLIAEPVTTSVVYCKQYWPGSSNVGAGGLFAWDALSTAAIDNGIVFAGTGNPSTGRWIRYKAGGIPTIDDFGAIGTKTVYNRDNTFAQSGAPQVALSAVFASVAAANNWYGSARVVATTESINSAAIQQAHAKCPRLLVPAGTYWINRSIEYLSWRSIEGAGQTLSTLLVEASAGACFTPCAVETSDSIGSEIYKRYFVLKNLGAWSNAAKFNFSTGDPVGTQPAYDATKSGFYCPPRKRDGAGGLVGNVLPAEANLGFPLLYASSFSNLFFGRFAGDGFHFGNGFSCGDLDNIIGDENIGFGHRYYQNVGTQVTRAFMLRWNQLGCWGAPNGGYFIGCNGSDGFAKDIPWGVIGVEGVLTNDVSCTFINCNFEGCQQALRVYGDARTVLMFDNCQYQWYTVDATRPFIECFGPSGFIRFRGKQVAFAALGRTENPNHFIKVRGAQWFIKSDFRILNGSTPLKYVNSDAAGAVANLGYGDKEIPANIGGYAGNGAGATIYGEYLEQQPATSIEKIYLGRAVGGGQNMVAIGTVDVPGTTAALPTIAATPGIYINSNTSAPRVNLVYLKTGTGSSGWVAI